MCECVCHWGMVDVLSDLEMDIYRFMFPCMKGQRGETERFTSLVLRLISKISHFIANIALTVNNYCTDCGRVWYK